MRNVIMLSVMFVLASCGPIEREPYPNDERPVTESLGQWQRDPNDHREVLDRKTLQDINALLADGEAMTAATTFGTTPADETFLYVNRERGLSVELPYSQQWGSSTYAVPPYHLHEEVSELRFGPLESGEGGGYGRRYTLAFRPARDAQTVAQDAEAQQRAVRRGEIPAEHLPRIVRGSGAVMVEWVDDGLCLYPTVEVIGQKFNYAFLTCTYDESMEGDWRALREAANSVRIME